MKRILTLLLTALCLAPLPLAGQAYKSAPVTISKEKVSKDGKVYLAHTVLDHQTLFSISRAYGVSYQDILDANPTYDLSRGQIQVGQVLLIPEKAVPAETVAAQDPGVQPASPRSSEPAVKDRQETSVSTVSAPAEYTVYVAKWYETLDMIATRFNIPKETLMAYNGMKTDQIERRQKIRIPAHPETVEVPVATTPATVAEVVGAKEETLVARKDAEEEEVLPDPADATVDSDTLQTLTDRIGFSLKDLFHKKKVSDRISVGVLLPFNAKGQLNHSSFDLYSGMLLAVRDLAKSGIKADLTVIDSKNAATPVTAEKLDALDLIIGPIAPDDLEEVLEICPHGTPVVSPLDPKALSLAESHSNFIQAPSPAEAQYRDIVEWIRDDFQRGDRVVLILEKDGIPTPLADFMAESGLDYTTLAYGLGESRSALERMRALTSSGSTLHAVIASDREVFVNDAIRNLSLLTYKGAGLILYGPSKIRTYDMVEVENLHRVNAHLSCSYFIDYDNPRMKDFLLSYRALFGAEPNQFAYQGYDAASYFIRNFSTAERDRERLNRMEENKYRGLQSDFLISDTSGRGHVNSAVRRVEYGKDYTISLLNQ